MHLGHRSLPPESARAILPAAATVGYSVHDAAQKSVDASGKEHPWRRVDVEDMYRRAGLHPTRPHRFTVWLRRRLGVPFFFDPR